MTLRFIDRRVLITGAAGGMGQAFARAFAAEGAALVLTDVDERGLQRLAAELHERGASCASHRVDLAVESEITAFGARICSEQPRLDVLINNAGLAYGEIAHGFLGLSQDKWMRYLSINTVAPLLLAQHLRTALANAKGVVLNISSMASYVPGTAYGVTKAALNAMTFAMAGAFGGDGIRVNGIAPGIMETPANKAQLPPEAYARIQGQQMLKLDGTAEDIAKLALFLASDDARFITNETVLCDAGSRIRGWRV
ncbi:MAG: SDR family oxidoreductase [Pseudomonadota bacterium]|nr:SDR family oxidoreductase [Pseudomonadota bacterium]